MPKEVDPSKLSPEEMLPPAEKMPTVSSVAESQKLLREDKKTALEALAKCSEEDLAKKCAGALGAHTHDSRTAAAADTRSSEGT